MTATEEMRQRTLRTTAAIMSRRQMTIEELEKAYDVQRAGGGIGPLEFYRVQIELHKVKSLNNISNALHAIALLLAIFAITALFLYLGTR